MLWPSLPTPEMALREVQGGARRCKEVPDDMAVPAPWFLFCSAVLLFWDALSIVSASGKMFLKLLHVLCFGIAFSVCNSQAAKMMLETPCAAAVELRRKKLALWKGKLPWWAAVVSHRPLRSAGAVTLWGQSKHPLPIMLLGLFWNGVNIPHSLQSHSSDLLFCY